MRRMGNRTDKQNIIKTSSEGLKLVIISLYMEVQSLNVCLSNCPIKTQKHLDRFASNFDWELGRTTEIF